jgi:alkaline phosphatase D
MRRLSALLLPLLLGACASTEPAPRPDRTQTPQATPAGTPRVTAPDVPPPMRDDGLEPTSPDAPAEIRSGPMLGYALQTEQAIWLQTTGPASVQIRYWPEGREADARTSRPVQASYETGYTAHVTLSLLEEGTTYQYRVLLGGEEQRRPYATTFATQPLWQWREEPPAFTIAFGSCYYSNDTPDDRPGRPYGGPMEIFGALTAADPDVMLWLGDNVYFREPDFGSVAARDQRHAEAREADELQPFLTRAAHLATWDDHDYGPNNADRSLVHKGTALDLFQRYWANPTYGLPGVPGVFTQYSYGDVDIFLLDDRYHRAPNDAPNDSLKTMWGEEQFQWLVDALTFSRAPFKLVANGGQFLNPYPTHEVLSRYPHEQQRLYDALAERRIDGVVFLSGDRHHGELLRLDRGAGLYPLHDVTSSPLTAGTGSARGEEDNPLRVEGTLVTERNFGTLSFSGDRRDRTMTVRLHSASGEPFWTLSVHEDELKAE